MVPSEIPLLDQRLTRGVSMAEHVVPHFHYDPGCPVIEIGAKEFMCVGATPPYDHPHVFLDIGEDKEIICPYCSTLYRFNSAPDPQPAPPPECALPLSEAACPASGIPTMAQPRHVIIAGAGIAGLTAALALARAGIRWSAYEQTGRLEETGAGVQLSPNGSRVLIALGLRERLASVAVAPKAIRVMSGGSPRHSGGSCVE